MSVMSRSLRNLTRNKSRTAIVVFIVGFSLAIFLTSSMVSSSISTNVSSLSESLETAITVRLAGTSDMSMMMPDQELMNESVLDQIDTVSHIDAINPILTRMVFDESSSDMFRRGTLVQAMDPSQDVFLTSGGTVTVTDGRTLDSGDVESYVALVGDEFADANGIYVDGILYVNESAFTVVGTFTTGTVFGDQSMILPYKTATVAYNVSGMNVVYVTATSIQTVDYVVEALQNLLGKDEYDIVSVATMTEEQTSSVQNSMDTIASSSEFGAMISVATAGAVMTFVMILVTRERTKEIGVLKALGFSNSKVSMQLLTESVTFSILGLAAGVVIAMVFAPTIASMFIESSSSSVPTMPDGPIRPAPTSSSMSVTGFTDLTLTPDLFLYGLLLAVGLGILGSLYPIISALRLTPAEALRYDF